MESIKKYIIQFYEFFNDSFPQTRWGIYRILVSTFCLVQYGILFPDLIFLFGKDGLVSWNITDFLNNKYVPTIGKLAVLTQNFMSDNSLVYLLFWMFIFSLFLLLIGLKTKIAAVIAWSIHFIFFNTGKLSAYGVESFSSIALFYTIFFPVEKALSLDNLLHGKNSSPSPGSKLSLRVLQIHLCIIYLASGLEKAVGQDWWNGNAIWSTVMEQQFRQFDFAWLAGIPLLAKISGWTTLLLETGYPICMWINSIKKFWFISIIGLHIGIAICMGLYLFSAIMIILNYCAFGNVEKHFLYIHQVSYILTSQRSR